MRGRAGLGRQKEEPWLHDYSAWTGEVQDTRGVTEEGHLSNTQTRRGLWGSLGWDEQKQQGTGHVNVGWGGEGKKRGLRRDKILIPHPQEEMGCTWTTGLLART